ncbi:MAG: alanine racemase [Acidimicrobiaceae bacterium]|nr:alanine racemase [Acidimicrobiaceae bacterium]MYC42605.1 alanine racemase [Acidimicrobiaceae bacterium]MYH87586.1 alanine racemase [Acidimicrobiaceae bacterium]
MGRLRPSLVNSQRQRLQLATSCLHRGFQLVAEGLPAARHIPVNLTVNLERLRTNYQIIREQLNGGEAAAVVKANGYGLGCVEVSTALAQQGCHRFFVAQLAEGLLLREAIDDVEIHVFNGAMPGTVDDLIEHRLIPALNSLEQIERWAQAAKERQQELPATIHIDTGMNRTGLGADETAVLIDEAWRLDALNVVHVMSHLGSADVADSTQPAEQLRRFEAHRRQLPMGFASLANSAGIFLGPAYHFDLVRPGVALYGGSPHPDQKNPMQQVVTLTAPILQVRNVVVGDYVGYAATHAVDRPGKVATIPVGYADGFLRSASNSAVAYVGSVQVPIIGRVSMDLITLDVTEVADSELHSGAPVELIGDQVPIDEAARRAGTISHEMLAALGARYKRSYVGELRSPARAAGERPERPGERSEQERRG